MKPKLEVQRVSYSYHAMEGETPALSDISFTADVGEFIAIVGPSGCGKSTLLSLLSGLAEPESGSILIDGRPGYHRIHAPKGSSFRMALHSVKCFSGAGDSETAESGQPFPSEGDASNLRSGAVSG